MGDWRNGVIRAGAAQWLAWSSLLVSTCVVANTGTDTQITYFEALSFTQSASLTANSKPTASGATSSLRFEAFGRAFTLSLQQNSRFAAVAQKLQADSSRQVLEGALQGDAASWVRLTRIHSRWHGMISSAGELYVIEPAEEVQAFAAPGLTMAKQGTVIFRLSDTYSALGQSFCGAAANGDTATPTELDAYAKLVADLKTTQLASQAPGATKRLEISALGDAAFLQQFSSVAEAEDAVIARLNNVDGIFTSQLGISIQVPSVDVYTHDPAFLSTSTSPTTLLDSVGRLRLSSPALQARGITHLFTGRDLDGTTVGIAYTKSLCNSRYGAGLTESRGRGTWTESLIAAHEIGHNFGAVHDGSGACASTPQTFLMAPQINGSSTFSQCSLNSMQELAQTAPCVATIPLPDIAVAADLGSVQGYTETALAWTVMVSNVGDAPSTAVHVDVALPSTVQFVSAEFSGGSCAMSNGTLACDLATLAAKSARALTVTLSGNSAGVWPVTASVHAASDIDSSNNLGSGTLTIAPSADLAASLTMASSIFEQTSATAPFTISNTGDVDSPNLIVDVNLPARIATATVTLEAAVCTANGTSVRCVSDVLPAQRALNGSIRLVGNAVGSGIVQLQVSSSYHDPDTSNNSVARTIDVVAPTDAGISEQELAGGSGGGGAFDWLLVACGALLAQARSGRLQRALQPRR